MSYQHVCSFPTILLNHRKGKRSQSSSKACTPLRSEGTPSLRLVSSMDSVPGGEEGCSECIPKAAANGRKMLYKCKRKQYDGVRAALQFLHPILKAWKETPVGHGVVRSARFSEDFVRLLHSVVDSSVPATLGHAGQLELASVGALQNPLWNELILAVFSHFPESLLNAPAAPCGATPFRNESLDLFPVPVGAPTLSGEPSLWSGAVTARYATKLTQVHGDRPSRDLCEGGYLHEAGLLSLSVFGDEAAGSSSAETDGIKPSSSTASRWVSLIDDYTLILPDRSHIHELENLPQEIAIGELVVSCARQLQGRGLSGEGEVRLMVDVGGGNGILAAQVGERLGCASMVIDPFFPSHSIDCCPRVWADQTVRERPAVARKYPLSRKVAFFHETSWADDIGENPHHTALVAKHLCGTAIDTCLAHLEAQGALPRILVLVPCCFNKGHYHEYTNKAFLRDVLRVNDEHAYGAMARLTDWNRSVYQKTAGGPLDGCRYSPTGVDRAGKRSKKSIEHLVSCGEALAESIETLLNHGRVLWLQRRGYITSLREYVPDCVTPKNMCIVAYRP